MHVYFVTAPQDKAEALAEQLLAERLIACANILPGVQSLYWWEGRLTRDTESLLLLKTTESRSDRLIARIREIHPYDVPEIIAAPIVAGNPDYLRWVAAETGGDVQPQENE